MPGEDLSEEVTSEWLGQLSDFPGKSIPGREIICAKTLRWKCLRVREEAENLCVVLRVVIQVAITGLKHVRGSL